MIDSKKSDKKNYFNLIIGLITLIIAIVGITFAYFTMTVGSNENDVMVQSAYVKIGYDGSTKIEAKDLIPTSENVMLWAYQDETRQNTTYTTTDDEGNEIEKTYQCIDKNNKKVCYVYHFTILSEGDDGDQTKILGKIRVNENKFIQTDTCGILTDTRSDLSYMVFRLDDNSTYTKVSGGNVSSQNTNDIALYENTGDEYKFVRFGIPSSSLIDDDDSIVDSTIENYLFGDDGYITIDNNVETSFELVIWLHDDGCNQDDEQGKTFSGTIDITVDSGDNVGSGGRVTGEN